MNNTYGAVSFFLLQNKIFTVMLPLAHSHLFIMMHLRKLHPSPLVAVA